MYDYDEGFETPLTDVRANCSCEFQLTNNFFTNDFASHNFQRIKNVQIFVKLNGSAPTDLHYLNAELNLLEGSVKNGSTFVPLCVTDSTMATSLAHLKSRSNSNSFNSEKNGLFEGCGAISKWSLSISGLEKIGEEGNKEYPIEDVIVYLTYTAKKGV